MRAITTSEGTFDAIQEHIVYVDSLGIGGQDGVFYPGRGELASLYLEDDFDRKLYDFWSDRISELGLSFNEEDYGEFIDFLKEYSRNDLFNPEKMSNLCDITYVKEHLQAVLSDYDKVFEPSANIKYLNGGEEQSLE